MKAVKNGQNFISFSRSLLRKISKFANILVMMEIYASVAPYLL
jgi:hypothetical protein